MEDFIQLVGVLIGSAVALEGLSTWRNQKLGSKRIELAEEILTSFIRFKEQMIFISNEFIPDKTMEEERSKILPSQKNCDYIIRAIIRKKKSEAYLEDMAKFLDKKYLAFAYFGDSLLVHFNNAGQFFTEQFATWNVIADQKHDPDAELFATIYEKREYDQIIFHSQPSPARSRLEDIIKAVVVDLQIELLKKGGYSYWREWLWPSI